MFNFKDSFFDLKSFIFDYWELEILISLPKPTDFEKKLIIELRQFLGKKTKSLAGRRWLRFSNRLKYYAKFFDPRNFLRWDVIKGTMIVAQAPVPVINELHKSVFWRSFKNAIADPSFGNHVPEKTLGSVSGTSATHVYHLLQLQKYTGIDFTKLQDIVEFGGGYGNMCRILRALNFAGLYLIFDIPEYLQLQKYYLQNIGLSVSDCQQTINPDISGKNCFTNDLKDLEILRTNRIFGKKLFIATWSLSESPVNLRDKVMNLVNSYDYFLIGFQKHFDGVDNMKYFADLKQKYSDIEWTQIYLDFWDGYYLIGKKIT